MATQMTRTRGFGGYKAQSGGGNEPKLTDLCEMLDFGKRAEYIPIRPIGEPEEVGVHDITFVPKGKNAKEAIKLTKTCLAWDRAEGTRDSTKQCPYCKLPNQRFKTIILSNVIDRAKQENWPAKAKPFTPKETKTGILDMNSGSYKPVAVLKSPPSLSKKLAVFATRNIVSVKGEKKQFDLGHPKFGLDIEVRFDNKADSPGEFYDAQKIDNGRIPLTEEERGYPLWDLSKLLAAETLERAKQEAKRFADNAKQHGLGEGGDDGTPAYDDEGRAKPGKKTAGKNRREEPEDEDDAGDDGDDGDEDLGDDDLEDDDYTDDDGDGEDGDGEEDDDGDTDGDDDDDGEEEDTRRRPAPDRGRRAAPPPKRTGNGPKRPQRR